MKMTRGLSLGIFLPMLLLYTSHLDLSSAIPSSEEIPRRFSSRIFLRRLEASTPAPTSETESPVVAATTSRPWYNFQRLSFVFPVISLSIMAWAARKHRLIVCCGEDELIPDEIVVPNDDHDDPSDDDSVVGDRATDIEMQPPHYWKRPRKAAAAWRRHDVSALRRNDDAAGDNGCASSNFVLMTDH